MERFIKLKDVSELTGIPVVTLGRYLRSGLGPVYKRSPHGAYLFHESDVEAWIEALPGPNTREQLESNPDVV